jgi:hypothetical protein
LVQQVPQLQVQQVPLALREQQVQQALKALLVLRG